MSPTRSDLSPRRFPIARYLVVAAVAIGLTAGSASAQIFGGGGPSFKPPAFKPPSIPLPKPPKIELPKPPKINIPKPPAISLPKPPKINVPKPPTINLPKPPSINLPKPPKVNLPPVKLPPVKLPDLKLPPVKLPPVKVPDVKFPSVKLPPVKLPPIKVPDVKLPPVKLPPVKLPPIKVPDVKLPPVKFPPVKLPDVKLPPIKLPPIKLPDVKLPPLIVLKQPDPNVVNDPYPTTPGNGIIVIPPTQPQEQPLPPQQPQTIPSGPNTGPIVIVIPPPPAIDPVPSQPVQPIAPPVDPTVPTVPPTLPTEPTIPTVPSVPEPATGGEQTVPVQPAMAASGGLRVKERILEAPAARAGIELGDILIKVGDRRVKMEADLTAALAAAGGEIEVCYFNPRSEKLETCRLTPESGSIGVVVEEVAIEVEEEAPAQPEPPAVPAEEVPTGETALQATAVTPRSAAARAGLQVGDVIVAINGKRVKTPEQLVEALKAAAAEGEAEVMFVNPDSGKAETCKMKVAAGELGLAVKMVAVSE